MTKHYEMNGNITKSSKKHEKRDSVLPNGELEGVYENVKDTGSIKSDKSSVKSEKPEKPKKVPMVGVFEVVSTRNRGDQEELQGGATTHPWKV